MKDGKDMHGGKESGEDHEIDLALALASRAPDAPEGAAARLMARIAVEPQEARVVSFPARAAVPRRVVRYAAAIPLAASLALGIYLGAKGRLDFMLPAAVTGSVASSDDGPDELGGVGEADAYAEENMS